ncbi:MAG: PQQ-binding-like beta-propeller repeat protein [Planctomycetota bacterium]
MSPGQLLDRLQELGWIDSKVTDKLRREVTSDQKIKPKAVVKYLLKKHLITKKQASELVDMIEAPAPVVHEEIAVAQGEKQYDTDDLTSTAKEEWDQPEPEPEKPAPVVDAPDFDPKQTVEEELPRPIDLVEVAQPIKEEPVEVAPHPVAPQNYADPFDADPLSQQQVDFNGEGNGNEADAGFKGKRLKKDQWATKWMYIGPAVLGLILMLGGILWYSLGHVSAEDQFKAAMDAFERNAWSDFLEKGEKFTEDNPGHDKVPTIRARLAQALIAQTYEQKNWDETIVRARTHLPPLVEDEDVDMNLIRDDLSVMLPNSALEITRRALEQTTLDQIKAELENALEAKSVVDNVSYIPGTMRKTERLSKVIGEIDDNILAIQGLIKKEDDYQAALGEISGLAERSETDAAFQVFQALTRKYGDLGARAELQELMQTVSTKERDLVQPGNVTLDVTNSAPESIVDNTIVLASLRGNPVEANRGVITPVFVDGTLFGIDSGDGSVAWRRFLGFETNVEWVEYNADLIVACDQSSNDVYMLKKLDGSVIWRTSVGEPFVQPAVSEAMVLVSTTSGKVIKLDPQSGNVLASVQLPQGVSVGGLIAEREPYIYQPGHYSNLYLLSQDDLSCKEVFYLGHTPGSIQVSPTAWTGLVLICMNGGDFSDLVVLTNTEEGIKRLQVLNRQVSGPVTNPLRRFGRWMLMAAENGDMSVLANDTTNEVTPITEFVTQSFDNRTGQRNFYFSKGTRLWIGGKGIAKYKLQGNLGRLPREVIVMPDDDFIAPMSEMNDMLLHVKRRGGSNMISVSAVNPDTLEEIWRSDIGGPLAGAPQVAGGNIMALSSQGDLFDVDAADIQSGYADGPVLSSTVAQNLRFDQILQLDDGASVAFGSRRADMLYFNNGESRLIKLRSPLDRISCPPVAVGSDVIIATTTGQVLRIDPSDGSRIGTMFQPPVDPSEQVQWLEPAFVNENTLAIAKNSDVNGNAVYLLDLSNRDSGISQVAMFSSASPIRSRLRSAGGTIYAVIGEETGDKLVSIASGNEMQITGEVELAENFVDGPWIAGSLMMVRDRADQLVAYNSRLQKVWAADLPAVKLSGGPVVRGSSIMCSFQDGQIMMLNDSDGTVTSSMDLGEPIVHGPVEAGGKIYFSGMDGTIHVITADGAPRP